MSTTRQHIRVPSTLLDSATDTITTFSGSWLFLVLHLLWFGLWIGLHAEPFPFGLLTMIVSLEAIVLSTLVMMSQNRSAQRDHMRDDHEAEIVDTMPAILSTILDLSKDMHTINLQQSDILNQQTDILNLLKTHLAKREFIFTPPSKSWLYTLCAHEGETSEREVACE